jgi:hypothetical protein
MNTKNDLSYLKKRPNECPNFFKGLSNTKLFITMETIKMLDKYFVKSSVRDLKPEIQLLIGFIETMKDKFP